MLRETRGWWMKGGQAPGKDNANREDVWLGWNKDVWCGDGVREAVRKMR